MAPSKKRPQAGFGEPLPPAIAEAQKFQEDWLNQHSSITHVRPIQGKGLLADIAHASVYTAPDQVESYGWEEMREREG